MHAELIQDLEAGFAGVERGDVRGAIQKTEGVVTAIDGAGFKGEGATMGDPAGQCRAQSAAQVLANVKIGDARAAAEPFEYATHGEIHAKGTHIDRKHAGTLKNIEDHASADFMGAFDDGAGVDDIGAAK